MALQNTGPGFWPPLILQGGTAAEALGNNQVTYDSSTDRVAWVGRSPVTDSLTTIYFRTGTVTTGCDVDVRIETVTNGRPSGTLFGTNTNIVVTIANGDDNVWKTATLTSAASLTKGDEFAIIITVSSGTPNLTLFANQGGGAAWAISGHYPLRLQDAGAGTWASVGSAWVWIAQFSSAGVVPIDGLSPGDTGTITSFNSGTSPNERALRFQVPFSCRAAGVRAFIFNVAAGGDFTASLWDATGNEDAEALAQASIDGDFAISTTQDGYVNLLFDSPVTLSVNTTYYLGIRADTANNIGVGALSNSTVSNAMLAFHGVNAQTYQSTRVWTAGTAGAWTDTTTALPLIHLIHDQLDDGTGSGGISARLIGGSLV